MIASPARPGPLSVIKVAYFWTIHIEVVEEVEIKISFTALTNNVHLHDIFYVRGASRAKPCGDVMTCLAN